MLDRGEEEISKPGADHPPSQLAKFGRVSGPALTIINDGYHQSNRKICLSINSLKLSDLTKTLMTESDKMHQSILDEQGNGSTILHRRLVQRSANCASSARLKIRVRTKKFPISVFQGFLFSWGEAKAPQNRLSPFPLEN